MVIFHTSGVFSYLLHHLDLALELGWSQYMHECVGASQGYHGVRVSGGVVGGFLAVGYVWYLPHRCGDSAVPRGST